MISFFVQGEARAKQSFRVGAHGRGFQTARVKAWQADVGWAGQQAMRDAGIQEPLTCTLQVELRFNLSTNRRIDADNLSKGCLDGLNHICWADDRQIMVLIIRKFVTGKEDCGVRITIDDLCEENLP